MSGSRRLRPSTVAVLSFWGWLGWPAPAHALELGLDVAGCPELPEKRVEELMELELTAKVARPATAERTAALVSVTCTGDDVRILVTDSTTSKAVSRHFTLHETDADVRARAVALAAAELVITSWMELVVADAPAQASATPAWIDENRREATTIARQHSSRGLRVAALFAFGAFGGTFQAAPGAWGGGVRLSLVWGEARFGFDSDLSATVANAHTSLGDVHTNTWSWALRPEVRLTHGPWLGSLGLGARVGLVRIEGSPSNPSTVQGHVVAGAWGGPLAHANFGFTLAPLTLRLGAEAGYAFTSVAGTVDGDPEAGVRGPWFLATLGFGGSA